MSLTRLQQLSFSAIVIVISMKLKGADTWPAFLKRMTFVVFMEKT